MSCHSFCTHCHEGQFTHIARCLGTYVRNFTQTGLHEHLAVFFLYSSHRVSVNVSHSSPNLPARYLTRTASPIRQFQP